MDNVKLQKAENKAIQQPRDLQINFEFKKVANNDFSKVKTFSLELIQANKIHILVSCLMIDCCFIL